MWVSPIDAAQPAFEPCTEIPVALQPFAKISVLAQERVEEFETLRAFLIADVQPRSFLEWLWTFDLAEVCWEALFCRDLRARALRTLKWQAEAQVAGGVEEKCRETRRRRNIERNLSDAERLFLLTETLTEAAQRRRFSLLKEMNTNRAFKARAVAYIQASHC